MARNGTQAGRKKGPRVDPLGGTRETGTGEHDAEGVDPGPSDRLRRALRSAELGGDEPGDEEPGDDEGGEGSSIPPPGPDEIVAFTETVRGQVLKLYGAVLGLNAEDPRVEALLTFTEQERASLRLWAPYAAKYVPLLIGKSEEIGAWVFVGVNVASLWAAMAKLRRLAPKKKHRDPNDPFEVPIEGATPPGFPPSPASDPAGP
jgi:hypothetical protein